MANFPGSPQNDQLIEVNGDTYIYASADGAWYKYQPIGANLVTTDTANIVSTVSSTSSTSGALRVAGGAGIAGNVYAGAVYSNSYFLANGAAFTGTAGFTGSVGFVGSTGASGFVGSAGAAAVVPKITAITYPGNDTAADTAGGQTITLTGSGFAAGASVVINGALVGVVTVVNSTTITFVSPALATGSYIVYVVNTDGTTAIAVPGIQYSGTPAWSTAAGSLGSLYETQAFSSSVTATGDAAITYSLQSGSLPPGATFNANGTISGTSAATASPTTYTFTVRATDAQNQDTDRTFSITVNPDAVTWNSPTNGTVYNVPQNSIISNVSLSATSAAGYSVQYAANALPTGLTLSGNIISGTPTATGNTNTLLTATAVTSNRNATQTISWVVSVAADTFFPYVTTLLSASTPASTFVTDASINGFAMTVNGDTRPSNFSPYTSGYYSGYFDGSGDFLSLADNEAWNLGSSDFSLEAWIYPMAIPSDQYPGIIGHRTTYVTNNGWGIFIGTASSIGFSYTTSGDGSATQNSVGASITASDLLAKWSHILVTRSGSQFRFFINGQLRGTLTANPTIFNSTAPLIIGKLEDQVGNHFTGYISNLRLVKGSIPAEYQTSSTTVGANIFTPPTAPLTAVANTQLLACQSNRFIDNSTNNFTITRNGDTAISGFDPFVPSTGFAGRGSGFFDGSGDRLTLPSSSNLAFGTGDFCVEAWTYFSANPADMTIFANFANSETQFAFRIDSSGYPKVQSWFTNYAISSTTVIPLQWYHLVACRVSNTLSIFINGTRTATATVTNNFSSTDAFEIGGKVGNDFVNGYISNLRVTKGSSPYNPTQTTITVPTTPLTAVANTQLLTLQNNQPTNNNMFLDSSTNNFNITRNGNTTQGTFSPYGGGWSAYFDGDGDNLILAPNAGFSFGTGDFTVEFWVYYPPYSNVDGKMVLDSRPGSSNGPYWVFGANGSGVMSFTTMTTGGVTLSDTVARTNQWVHYAATRSGTSLRLFANGTQVASATNSDNISSSDLRIGTNAWAGQAPTTQWVGYISNVRIVKGTAVYTSNFTPSTTPLTPIVNTQLLTCADNRFIDDGPNNFAITRNGNTSIQRFSPFNPVVTTPTSYSGFFDGTGDYLTAPNNAAFAFGTGDFTIECWLYYIIGGSTDRFIVDSGNGSNFLLRYGGGTTLQFYANSSLKLTQAVALQNAWNHIAVVRSGTTYTMYINGSVVNTGTGSENISNSTVIGIGAINTGAGDYFSGYISNLRIVKGTAVYTSAFTPSTTPLTAVANTSLLTCQSATFTDNSTNNFAIIANGDTAARQFNPFGWTSTTGSSAAYTPALYGGSAYFDGSGDYLSVARNSMFLPVANEDFTIEAWIYLTATPSGVNNAQIVGFGEFGSDSDWAFIVQGDVRLAFNIGGTAYVNSTVISLYTWNHVAVSRSGTASNNLKVFVNGIGQSFSTNSTTVGSGNRNLSIGADQNGDEAMWPGYISDIRITKGQGRYISNFAPPVAPLTALANTTLLTNMTGASIYDSSMMGNYETVGTAQISTSVRPFGSGGSIAIINSHLDGCAIASGPQFAFGTGNWTVEGWFYTSQSGSTKQTLVMNLNQPTGMSMSVSTSSIEFRSSGTTDISGSGVSSNTWTYIAWVRNGNTVTIYRNGTSIVSGTYTNSMGPSNFYVGPTGGQSGVANTFNYLGYIADLRITRGIARYTTNFTPTSSPFILN